MRKLITFSLAIVLLMNFSYAGKYKIAIKELEIQKKIDGKYERISITHFKDFKECMIEDSILNFRWSAYGEYNLTFYFKNVMSHQISILWDDVTYTDEQGINHKLIHHVLSEEERSKYVFPSIFILGAHLEEILDPYSEYSIFTFIHFVKEETEDELLNIASTVIGKTIILTVPIKVKDMQLKYIFTYKITGFCPL